MLLKQKSSSTTRKNKGWVQGRKTVTKKLCQRLHLRVVAKSQFASVRSISLLMRVASHTLDKIAPSVVGVLKTKKYLNWQTIRIKSKLVAYLTVKKNALKLRKTERTRSVKWVGRTRIQAHDALSRYWRASHTWVIRCRLPRKAALKTTITLMTSCYKTSSKVQNYSSKGVSTL